jgi:hypothetical protein
MEALKEIPQIFFDLVARVAPGMFALFILDSSRVPPWATLLSVIAAGRLDSKNVFMFAAITALAGAYILGHFLSLASKHLEALGEWCSRWIAAAGKRREVQRPGEQFKGWRVVVADLRREDKKYWEQCKHLDRYLQRFGRQLDGFDEPDSEIVNGFGRTLLKKHSRMKVITAK